MKTSVGFISVSTRREGQAEDYFKVTTLVLTIFDERVGSGGDDIELTTLISLSKGRVGSSRDEIESTTLNSLSEGSVGSTTCSSLYKERVGPIKDGTGSTSLSINGSSRENLWYPIGIPL